ncbi:hypothetical protein GCM10022222_57080 [Amycolatopsis ultiminotia]|uniref:AAA domain-containing protein n=1 Tax=Amycolatopsis ultiminotia TaxID=543629 RepID=A0ABP6XEB0_9PSEU
MNPTERTRPAADDRAGTCDAIDTDESSITVDDTEVDAVVRQPEQTYDPRELATVIEKKLTRRGLDPVGYDDGTWIAKCPVHRDDAEFEWAIDAYGVYLGRCTRECLPGELIDVLGLDRGPAFPFVTPEKRAALRHARHDEAVELARRAASGEPGRFGDDTATIMKKLRVALKDGGLWFGRSPQRWKCPSCGDTEHGGMRVTQKQRRVLAHCYHCGDELAGLARLGITPADLCVPGLRRDYDGSSLLFEYEDAEGAKHSKHGIFGTFVESSGTADNPTESSPAVVRTLADVEPETVTWLWGPNRLPAGKLIILDGDPSQGKSTLAVTLAAHLSTGTTWPDGQPCPLGDVVLMSAEDGLGDTVVPRLLAAGGDRSRVHALTSMSTVDEDGNRYERPVTLADMGTIHETVKRYRARLLIVDVLMAYMPGTVDSHRDQDVRTVLARLAAIADETGCAVLLLRHLNKASGGNVVYRGGGSIGIIGAARAGYVVAPDPDDETRRVLACTKNNLAQMPSSLTYRLESTPDSHVAKVVWYGESAHQASELLTTTTEEASEQSDAVAFIDKYLVDCGGKSPAKDVLTQGEKGGFTRSTMYRAAKTLGVRKEKDGMRGRWWWTHPADAPAEDSTDSPSAPEDSTKVPKIPRSKGLAPSEPSRGAA